MNEGWVLSFKTGTLGEGVNRLDIDCTRLPPNVTLTLPLNVLNHRTTLAPFFPLSGDRYRNRLDSPSTSARSRCSTIST